MISDKRYKYDKAGNSIANMFSNPIDMQAGSTDSSSGDEEKDQYLCFQVLHTIIPEGYETFGDCSVIMHYLSSLLFL